jgi:hypothetical protein
MSAGSGNQNSVSPDGSANASGITPTTSTACPWSTADMRESSVIDVPITLASAAKYWRHACALKTTTLRSASAGTSPAPEHRPYVQQTEPLR